MPAIPPIALVSTPSQLPPAAELEKFAKSPEPKTNAPTPTPMTVNTLSTVSSVAAFPVAATEAQLKSVTSQSAPSAKIVRPLTPMPSPNGSVNHTASSAPPKAVFKKIANPTASAACEPVFMMAKTVQPYKKLVKRP